MVKMAYCTNLVTQPAIAENLSQFIHKKAGTGTNHDSLEI
jgi:hypothetical protein